MLVNCESFSKEKANEVLTQAIPPQSQAVYGLLAGRGTQAEGRQVMAELILTDEERKSTWANADEVALGKAVKYVAFQLGLANDHESYAPAVLMAAANTLIGLAEISNADKMTQTMTNVIRKGVAIGDWAITIKKVKPKKGGSDA
jgi:hypothetical protein